MDSAGERRLPAARDVIWAALSDRGTLMESLPPALSVASVADEGWELELRVAGENWRTQVAPEPGGGAARAFLALSRPADATHGFGGRAEITMAEDGPFTRVFWRVVSDLPDQAGPDLREAADYVLTQIGQRSAGPTPIAAQGAAGAAAAIAAAAPTERTPLGAILQSLAALPRDSTVGGAVFILVVLFVVGVL